MKRLFSKWGFRKIDPDGWEFATEGFLRGQKQLLKHIKRRKASSQPLPAQEALDPRVEVGIFGLDGEANRLRRDKQVLMMELVKLRQQQQNTRAYLRLMEQRLQGTEQKQQQMMAFLAKAVQNPSFIQQLVQRKGKLKEIGEKISKKRGRSIDCRPSGVRVGESSRCAGRLANLIKNEPLEFGDCGYEVSELEALAFEMQGFSRARKEQEEGLEHPERIYKELDEGFWEELLNESFNGELDISGSEASEDEDVSVLADQLGYLGSSPK